LCAVSAASACSSGTGRPEALGILFGEEQRHAEQLGSIDEAPGVFEDGGSAVDHRH
jgi:hypothetical protein